MSVLKICRNVVDTRSTYAHDLLLLPLRQYNQGTEQAINPILYYIKAQGHSHNNTQSEIMAFNVWILLAVLFEGMSECKQGIWWN